MTRFAVRLAEVPADALEVLVDRGGTLDAPTVTAALDHPATELRARNALALLRDLGLATQTFNDRSESLWAATADGRAAVVKARTRAHEAGICDQVGHEMRPTAGGCLACVCCGVPADDPAPGTFREDGDSA